MTVRRCCHWEQVCNWNPDPCRYQQLVASAARRTYHVLAALETPDPQLAYSTAYGEHLASAAACCQSSLQISQQVTVTHGTEPLQSWHSNLCCCGCQSFTSIGRSPPLAHSRQQGWLRSAAGSWQRDAVQPQARLSTGLHGLQPLEGCPGGLSLRTRVLKLGHRSSIVGNALAVCICDVCQWTSQYWPLCPPYRRPTVSHTVGDMSHGA
jgi:hypothetical protein